MTEIIQLDGRVRLPDIQRHLAGRTTPKRGADGLIGLVAGESAARSFVRGQAAARPISDYSSNDTWQCVSDVIARIHPIAKNTSELTLIIDAMFQMFTAHQCNKGLTTVRGQLKACSLEASVKGRAMRIKLLSTTSIRMLTFRITGSSCRCVCDEQLK